MPAPLLMFLYNLQLGHLSVDSPFPIYLQARPLLSRALDTGNLEGLVDHRLEKKLNQAEMFRMIEAAAACIRHSASRRPRMSQVPKSNSVVFV